jgi:putative ABC transport system permease protein
MLNDIRYAIRTLRNRPTFTAIAIVCLALGIGASAAIFTVVDSVLLKPLPFPQSGELLSVNSHPSGESGGSGAASGPDFVDWRSQATALEPAAYRTTTFNVRRADAAVRLQGATVSANLFRVLRVAPMLGRTFTPEEELTGRGDVAILSHELWQREFNGDPNIIGKTIRLDAATYAVVGVMPKGFAFPIATERAQLWTPLTLSGDGPAVPSRGAHSFRVIARLAPGATAERAQNELAAISRRLAEQYPATNAEWTASVLPLRDALVGGSRHALLVLAGAVCFLLLIACGNVANLMLARATMQTRDVAVRTALGASRTRIIRQLITEGVVLALVAGVAGVLLAWWGVGLLIAKAPAALPRMADIALDWRALLFTLVVSVLTGLLFAIAPALQITAGNLQSALREGGRSMTGPGSAHRLRSALVISEIALSLVLLAGAGLLGASLMRLERVRAGFDARDVITTRVSLSSSTYASNAKTLAFYDRLLESVSGLREVKAAGLVSVVPLSGSNIVIGMQLEGEPRPTSGGYSHAEDLDIISADYFRAMAIPLISGRAFTVRDDSASPNVMVVSEAFAKKYWPGQSPIGKRVITATSPDSGHVREVVGVVGDIHRGALDAPPRPAMYLPIGQLPFGSLSLVVRTNGNAPGLADAIRRAVTALDPDQALTPIRPMEDVIAGSLARQRFSAFLLSVFAGVALLLSAIGIYGVMASMVAQRRREIAVRMALGARPNDVVRMVVRHGAVLAGIGMAAGIVAALALSRVLVSLLYGTSTADPVALLAVSAVLGGVALLASYLPARRATRVDPAMVLGAE